MGIFPASPSGHRRALARQGRVYRARIRQNRDSRVQSSPAPSPEHNQVLITRGAGQYGTSNLWANFPEHFPFSTLISTLTIIMSPLRWQRGHHSPPPLTLAALSTLPLHLVSPALQAHREPAGRPHHLGQTVPISSPPGLGRSPRPHPPGLSASETEAEGRRPAGPQAAIPAWPTYVTGSSL